MGRFELLKVDCGGPGIRPSHHPPAQSRRVQQHDPRSRRRRFPAGRDFPADDVGYGFDNIAMAVDAADTHGEILTAREDRDHGICQADSRKRIMIVEPSEKTKLEDARKILERFASELSSAEHSGRTGPLAYLRQVSRRAEGWRRKRDSIGGSGTLVSPYVLFASNGTPTERANVDDYALATGSRIPVEYHAG